MEVKRKKVHDSCMLYMEVVDDASLLINIIPLKIITHMVYAFTI